MTKEKVLQETTDLRNIYPYRAFLINDKEGNITLPDGKSVSILEIPPAVITKVMHKVLTEEQERVLEHRLGGYNGSLMTLEETGSHMGIARERVRVLEAKALKALNNPSTAEMLVTSTCEVCKQ